MKRLLLISLLAYLSACHTPPSQVITSDISGNYVLDPSHASVVWSLSHAGLSNYTARFDDISGTLSFDATTPENSQVDILVKADSINTGLADFDIKIATANDGFDSQDHPDIQFVSTGIKLTGGNTGDIIGNLILRGQSQPVTLKAIFNGAGKSFGHPGETLGFSASAEIDRTDWGVTKWTNFGIGEIVTLRIEAEFNEKQ